MGNCETRALGQKALVGMPSRPKATVGTQTALRPFPPKLIHQAIDTSDLEKGMKGLSVATQTPQDLAGKEEGRRAIAEVGAGEIKGDRDSIPGGWEMMWIQDPWTGK